MYNTDMPTRAELPSTGQLVRSTLIALATAMVLLVTVILPSEYAIDPTGIGRLLGLTEMGEIKQQLADEAEAFGVVAPLARCDSECAFEHLKIVFGGIVVGVVSLCGHRDLLREPVLGSNGYLSPSKLPPLASKRSRTPDPG